MIQIFVPIFVLVIIVAFPPASFVLIPLLALWAIRRIDAYRNRKRQLGLFLEHQETENRHKLLRKF